jgi:hypothetical protein
MFDTMIWVHFLTHSAFEMEDKLEQNYGENRKMFIFKM